MLLRFPFSRSYGVILPSSLTMLLPFVLGSSPHLPVSVSGTGISIQALQAFLVSVILDTSLLIFSLSLSVRVFPLPRLSSSTASLVSFKYSHSAGISTCCPSDTPFGLSLGPDLPWADEPSPVGLRIFFLPTCVGLRYGHRRNTHSFSRHLPSRTSVLISLDRYRNQHPAPRLHMCPCV